MFCQNNGSCFLLKAILWALIFYYVNVKSVVTASPSIHLGRIAPAAKALLYPDIPENRTIELDKNLTEFQLICSDSDPVTWVYDGVEAPHRFRIMALHNITSPPHQFQVILSFRKMSAQLTGKYTCKHVHNDNETDGAGASIFIYGQQPFYFDTNNYKYFLLLHGRIEEIKITRSTTKVTFPCSVTLPDALVKLKRKYEDRAGFKEIETGRYLEFHPITGFTFDRKHPDFAPGTYICTTSRDDMVMIKLVESQYEFTPDTEAIEVIIDANDEKQRMLEAECSGPLPVKLNITGTDPNDPGVKLISGHNENAEFPYYARIQFTNVTESDLGTVNCLEVQPDRSVKIVKTWNYRTRTTNFTAKIGWKNYLQRDPESNNSKRQFRACWSQTITAPLVRFIHCKNSMECDIKRRCIEQRSTLCDNSDFRICPGGCVRGRQLDQSGFYHCAGDGLDLLPKQERVSWNLFGYSHLKDPAKLAYLTPQELLSPQNRSDVLAIEVNGGNPRSLQLYQGNTTTFTCIGSAFLFAQGFQWHFEFKRGGGNASNLEDSEQVKIISSQETILDLGLIQKQSRILINTTNAISLTCIAYLWDPDMLPDNIPSVKTTLFLNVTETSMPTLDIDHPTVPTYRFDGNNDGTDENIITCPAHGTPPPNITWFKDNAPKDPLPDGIIIANNTLSFRFVSKAQAGTYTCVASNLRGVLQTPFKVEIYFSFEQTSRLFTGLGILGAILLFVLLGIVLSFWKKIQYQRRMLRDLTTEEIAEFEKGNPEAFDPNMDTTNQAHLLAYNSAYEFPTDQLRFSMSDKLGAGEFGLVLKGYATNICPAETETLVAVKTVKGTADVIQFKSLLMELKIMSRIGRHPHLVNLLGACTRKIEQREVYIITEFCGNGSLEAYLREKRSTFANHCINNPIYDLNQPHSIGISHLINWSFHIASGMNFLAQQRVIHGDLATRNVLLTEHLIAKVGDFGLSRRIYAGSNYVKKQQVPLPWKWMAIESLRDMEFSTKSDVWAYGVALWEIFTLGETPYPGISWTFEFLQQLKNGYRLTRPLHASESIYNLMKACWHEQPQCRPTFDLIIQQLSNIMHTYDILHMQPASCIGTSGLEATDETVLQESPAFTPENYVNLAPMKVEEDYY